MKTNETKAAPALPPGNVSTRQLAATLSKTPTAPGQTATETAKTETSKTDPEAATREALPAKGEGEAAETVESQTGEKGETSNIQHPTSNAEVAEAGEDAGAPREEAAAEAATAEAAEKPEAEIAGEDAGAARELPAEVAEAMEIAKAQDGGKGKADLLKRVYKLVDQRDTERNARLAAEEALAKTSADLEAARKGEAVPIQSNDVHPAVAAVQSELRNVDHWLGNLRRALPELRAGRLETLDVPDGKGGVAKLNQETVEAMVDELGNSRVELVARKVQTESQVKAAFEQMHRAVHAEAVQRYPWLTKPDSPEKVRMQALLKAMPQIKQFPDYELVVGDYLRGEALRLAENKARANGAAPRKSAAARDPARVAIESSPSGTSEKSRNGESAEAEQQFEKTGRTSDLAKSFSAKRAASRARK